MPKPRLSKAEKLRLRKEDFDGLVERYRIPTYDGYIATIPFTIWWGEKPPWAERFRPKDSCRRVVVKHEKDHEATSYRPHPDLVKRLGDMAEALDSYYIMYLTVEPESELELGSLRPEVIFFSTYPGKIDYLDITGNTPGIVIELALSEVQFDLTGYKREMLHLFPVED